MIALGTDKYLTDIEHKILLRLLSTARRDGFIPTQIDDGGDDVIVVINGNNRLVIESIDAVKWAAVTFWHQDGERFTVVLVPGNGIDLISDYTETPASKPIMNKIQNYADSLRQ